MTLTQIVCPLVLLALVSSALAADTDPLVQRLMPLPKEIALTGTVTVPIAALRLQLPAQATALDQSVAAELTAALGVDLAKAKGANLLIFQRTPAATAALQGKRHADQGYLLTSDRRGNAVTITCDATSDVGSYYAMKTLKQLLLAGLRGTGDAATVDLPLGRILDWPDMEERGQWGGTCVQDLEKLSDLKSNLIELHADLTVDDKGVGHAAMKPEVMERARTHAVRIVPIIHHLEQLEGTGMFKAYPQLEAVGEKSTNPSIRAVCFSRPEIVTLLSQWMAELGQVPDVREVMVWLSEEGKGCQCDQCKQVDRFVAEVRALTAAWQEAKRTVPKLGLRLLLTQTSYGSNDKVLGALVPGVKISYYHGGLTYNTERKPMIYPLLADYVKQGHWMGVYPTLSSNWLTVAPFTNPEFTHYRLTEFVDKGLQNLVAYIVPTADYYQVNTAGGLEWSWNAHGRTPQQFAASWAIRQDLKDPAKFVQFTELIGPPAWDVYGSSFPYLENWGSPTAQIAAGKMKFELGKSIFTEFKTEDKFVTNLALCQQALAAAQELGEPQFINEAEIVLSYTQVLQSVWQLSQILRGDEGPLPESRPPAEKWFRQCQTALDKLVDTYPQWSAACQPGAEGKPPERFTATAHMMERLASNMSDLMEKHGFVDESKPYRMHQIGSWKTEEFAQAKSQARRLDVSALVTSAGKYTFRPIYRSGSLGLTANQVALVSFPKDKPEEVREEAVDKHNCHAGAWAENDVYTLELKEYDPARGYAVIANINGGDSTAGDFFFRKLK